MAKHLLILCVLITTAAGAPMAQVQGSCLHGRSESTANRMRRDQAMRLAQRINIEQRGPLVPPAQRRYRPLDQLNLPQAPRGFDVKLLTDGDSYLFSLRDGLDPCHYAIHSDDSGAIYAGEADNVVTILPAGTH